jgi:hypothetical protein
MEHEERRARLPSADREAKEVSLPPHVAAELADSRQHAAETCELRNWSEIAIDNDKAAPRAVIGQIYNHPELPAGMWVVTEDVLWTVRDPVTDRPTALVCPAYEYRLGDPMTVGAPPRHVLQRCEVIIAQRRERRRDRLAAQGRQGDIVD